MDRISMPLCQEKCISCLVFIIANQSSGMAANGGGNGTSTTAGGKQGPITNKVNTNNTVTSERYCG
eukprot:4597105-Ditylum_brightwellii.AAC.1